MHYKVCEVDFQLVAHYEYTTREPLFLLRISGLRDLQPGCFAKLGEFMGLDQKYSHLSLTYYVPFMVCTSVQFFGEGIRSKGTNLVPENLNCFLCAREINFLSPSRNERFHLLNVRSVYYVQYTYRRSSKHIQ